MEATDNRLKEECARLNGLAEKLNRDLLGERIEHAHTRFELETAQNLLQCLRDILLSQVPLTGEPGHTVDLLRQLVQQRDEARAMVGFLKDVNESDLRLLRATEAALDAMQVHYELSKK